MSGQAAAKRLLCSVQVKEQWFGIETSHVREVLMNCLVQRVPMSPGYIAGIVTYRGDVLTTVSLRVVLGFERSEKGVANCVVVLDDADRPGQREQFGLEVDAVSGVVPTGEDLLRTYPPVLSEFYAAVACAAYRVPAGVMVQLDPGQLKPPSLARRWVARAERKADGNVVNWKEGQPECEH